MLTFSASTLLAATGDLDASFGTGGQVFTLPADSTSASAKAVAVQPDGKIVVAGYSWHDDANNTLDRYDFLVARYLVNGDPDPTFGTGGVVLTKVSPALLAFDHADEIIIQPDGKILILGFSRAGSFDEIALIRYEANGNLDETFGDLEYVSGGEGTPVIYKGKGYIRLDAYEADGISSSSLSNGYGMALQPDGKILVTGYARTSLVRQIVVARYDRNGQLDTSFDTNGSGNAGIRVWRLGLGSDEGRAIAVQPDGKIAVAGITGRVPGSVSCCSENPFLVRLLADSSYDPSDDFFQDGADGIAEIVSVDSHDTVTDLVIQPDGKFLVVGYTEATFGSSIKDIILVRWNADGSLDTDFGTNGTVRKTTVSEKEWGYALVVQPNGKILVAGRTANSGLVLRYNIDGSIDSNFGSAGQVVIPTLGQADGIALQPNGDILIAGPGYGAGLPTGGSMSVVRLIGTPVDLLPSAFAFTDQTDVATSAEVLSDMVSVVGFNVGNSVPIRVTGGELAVNGVYQTFGYVKSLDQINVRHTSAATEDTVTETTVTAGGLHAPDNIALVLGATRSDTFSSTTSGDDTDGDGIQDAIDGIVNGVFNDQSTAFSSDFTDQHLGGFTRGSIVDRGDNLVTVTDDPVLGVILEANGGTGTSQVEMCDPDRFNIFLTDGDQIKVTCGSLAGEVGAGLVDVDVALNVSVAIPVGASFFMDILPGSILSISNLGETGGPDMVIDDDGVISTLGPDDPPLQIMLDQEADTDGDGVVDSQDNCTLVANPPPDGETVQRDTNGDGFGNRCDPDLNNDGLVTVIDFLILRGVLNSADEDADLNGDGLVTVTDFLILRGFLNQPPGPSGLVP